MSPSDSLGARYGMTAAQRRRVMLGLMKRQRNVCYLCKCHMTLFVGAGAQPRHAATIDHVVPLSGGGGWNDENLAACCYSCNQEKGAMVPAMSKKGEKKQARQHARHMKKFAAFQTKLHCGIPLRGGWL